MTFAALARKSETTSQASLKAPAKPEAGELRIGEHNDAFEREADRAATAVMTSRGGGQAFSLSKLTIDVPLQRKCSCGAACDACRHKWIQRSATAETSSVRAPIIVHEALQSPGQKLDPATREWMQARFGHDFSGVRIFNDSVAAKSAQAVSANAYTVGEKIVFNQGKYSPGSASGKRLLAHELAHVVQQSRGGSAPRSQELTLESEATHAARAIDRFEANVVVRQSSAVGIARDAATPNPQQLIEVHLPDGVKQLTPEQFAEYKRRAINNLRVDLRLVTGLADSGRQNQQSMLEEYQGGVESLWDAVKKPKALIGIAADIKAGVTPPYIGAWANSKQYVEAGLAACDQGDLVAAARHLQTAEASFKEALHNWNTYRDATIGGASGVVSNLETVRDVSFAIALAAGAAVAAPVIAAGVAGLGATGAGATVLTTAGTALATGTGGAVLGGGSTAVASLASTGKVDIKAAKADAIKFGKQGVVTGLTAGLGTGLGAAAKGAKLAQPLIQTAAKRCLTEAGINVAGEITTQALDAALSAPDQERESEGAAKPVLPGPARAALTGCLSGALGVPVAKLGHAGAKASELAVTGGVGYLDARLSGQSNKEALLAAGQGVLTSAAIAHGHAGTEHAKAVKQAAKASEAVPGTPPRHPSSAVTEDSAADSSARGAQSSDHPDQAKKPVTEKIIEKQKAETGHEGAPAILKEDAKAKYPVGDGHDAVVTELGVARCSPSPCPVIHVEFAKELADHPWARHRYEELEQTRKSNPERAAKEAARFIKSLEMVRRMDAKAGQPTSQLPSQALTEPPKGQEVFQQLSDELGLKGAPDASSGGVRTAVKAAIAAGFINPDGSAGTVDLGVQHHANASAAREGLGVTGGDAQSAHVGPTSALRDVPGYSRGGALTTLLPPETHAAFDQTWKDWAMDMRRQGRTTCTAGELRDVMVEAINKTPGVPDRTKGALVWRLQMELFEELKLQPTSVITLPYRNIPPQ